MVRKELITLMVVLSVIGIAAAATIAELTISPKTQTIDVTPSPNPVVTYTVTLKTNDPAGSPGELSVSTDDSAVWAKVGGTPTSQFSSHPFTVAGVPDSDGVITMTFSLSATVDEANEASVTNENHKIRVKYQDKEGETLAMVTGNITPVPEVSTGILMSAGLIGLVGLVRFRRKD